MNDLNDLLSKAEELEIAYHTALRYDPLELSEVTTILGMEVESTYDEIIRDYGEEALLLS